MNALPEMLFSIILWILIIIGIISAIFLPTICNFAISLIISFKLVNYRFLRAIIFIFISALLSWNVRIPDMIVDMYTDTHPSFEIKRKILLRPDEKIFIDIDKPIVFYRRTSEVSLWGFNNNLDLGILPVPMINEYPIRILQSMKLPTTDKVPSRVTFRLSTKLDKGLVNIHAELIDEKGIASHYSHVTRRNYNLENLDYKGLNKEKWKGYFSLITQNTPWNLSKTYYKNNYSPISEFLDQAIVLQPVTKEGIPVSAINDPLEIKENLVELTLASAPEKIPLDDIPSISYKCDGSDVDGKMFSARISLGVSIDWQDKDIPGITFGGRVEGRYPFFSNVYCNNSIVTVTSIHKGKINLWRYKIFFRKHSLIQKEWKQLAIPKELLKEKGIYKGHLISSGDVEYNFILARYEENYRSKLLPKAGYLLKGILKSDK